MIRKPGERFVTFVFREDGAFAAPPSGAARGFMKRSDPRLIVEAASHPTGLGMSSGPTRKAKAENRKLLARSPTPPLPGAKRP